MTKQMINFVVSYHNTNELLGDLKSGKLVFDNSWSSTLSSRFKYLVLVRNPEHIAHLRTNMRTVMHINDSAPVPVPKSHPVPKKDFDHEPRELSRKVYALNSDVAVVDVPDLRLTRDFYFIRSRLKCITTRVFQDEADIPTRPLYHDLDDLDTDILIVNSWLSYFRALYLFPQYRKYMYMYMAFETQ